MQTKKENKRMCRCTNVANYRKKNNEIKNVVDIFARINDVHKMGMFTEVDWKMQEKRKMFDVKVYI